jgi:spore coat polysaccharide biosynthesis predicted glycosyltransferase SpsG
MKFTLMSVRTGSAEDANATARMATLRTAAWTVLDGYRFGVSFQRRLIREGLRLAVIDDQGKRPADGVGFVLNQNLHARSSMYTRCGRGPPLLLGPRFALLRREFREAVGRTKEISNVATRILVTLGGSAHGKLLFKIVEAVAHAGIGRLEVVVASPGPPVIHELRRAVESSRDGIELRAAHDDLPRAMNWADIAISGGGSTCWELSYSGTPMMVFPLAKNQVPIARSIESAGAGVDVGSPTHRTVRHFGSRFAGLCLDPERRRRMSRIGRTLVDGKGASRVVREAVSLASRARMV